MKKPKISIIIDTSIINSHHGVRRYLLSLANGIKEFFDVDFFKVESTDIIEKPCYTKIIFDREFAYNNGFSRNSNIPLADRSSIISHVVNESLMQSEPTYKYTSVFVGTNIDQSDICIIGAPWICSKIDVEHSAKVYCVGYDAIPVVYSFKEYNDKGLTEFAYLHYLGYKKAVSRYDGILAISPKSKSEISTLVGNTKVFVIPPFLPIGFDNVMLDNKPRNKTVILAAPFDRRKGLHGLPSIINSSEVERLIIFGGVRCSYEEVFDFFKAINIEKCEWWYSVDTDKQIELYKTASLLIFPSLNEGLGLPVLEALACGTDVVVSDIEPLNSLVDRSSILSGLSTADNELISGKFKNFCSIENRKRAISNFGVEKLSGFIQSIS